MKRAELEEMIGAHQAEIGRYVRYLGARDADVEDIVQDVFLAAFRSARGPAAADPAGRAAWLRGIARHIFLSRCRRDRANPVRTDGDSVERAERVWSGTFLRSGDGFDYVEALRGCLEKLPSGARRMLDLFYAEGRSREETAAASGLSGDGVKSGLRRLRNQLARCIGRQLGLEPGTEP